MLKRSTGFTLIHCRRNEAITTSLKRSRPFDISSLSIRISVAANIATIVCNVFPGSAGKDSGRK